MIFSNKHLSTQDGILSLFIMDRKFSLLDIINWVLVIFYKIFIFDPTETLDFELILWVSRDMTQYCIRTLLKFVVFCLARLFFGSSVWTKKLVLLLDSVIG